MFIVQFTEAERGVRVQDFVLGWALHLPYVSPKGNVPESEIQLDLTMGPGISVTGDVVWDQSQVRSKD